MSSSPISLTGMGCKDLGGDDCNSKEMKDSCPNSPYHYNRKEEEEIVIMVVWK